MIWKYLKAQRSNSKKLKIKWCGENTFKEKELENTQKNGRNN